MFILDGKDLSTQSMFAWLSTDKNKRQLVVLDVHVQTKFEEICDAVKILCDATAFHFHKFSPHIV